MREMVYCAERICEVLHKGEYKGYKFYIINLGTHPTAYVECKLDGCNSYGDERLDNINVHGGFTYLDNGNWDYDSKSIYFIGWDYAHYMDYAGYEVNFPSHLRSGGKRWTTEEIFEEVKSVIDQFIATEKGGAQE